MQHRKTKAVGLTLAFCFLGEALCFAADPQMGTWNHAPCVLFEATTFSGAISEGSSCL
jgi:hypothetical protein